MNDAYVENLAKNGNPVAYEPDTAEASALEHEGPSRRQRRGNRQRMKPVSPIKCVGGPYDGQTTKMVNPSSKLKLTVEQDDGTEVTHIYGRKNTRSGVEYHFKETVPADVRP